MIYYERTFMMNWPEKIEITLTNSHRAPLTRKLTLYDDSAYIDEEGELWLSTGDLEELCIVFTSQAGEVIGWENATRTIGSMTRWYSGLEGALRMFGGLAELKVDVGIAEF